jgi:outer membrane autotransporter protein
MSAFKTMSAFRKRSLLAGAAAALLLAPLPAFAADVVTTVPAGGDHLGPIAADAPNAGDTYTIDNGGFIHGPNVFVWSDLVITGTGAGHVTINNDGRIQGVIDFSGLTGGVTFNNNTGPNAETQGWFFEVLGGNGPIFSAGNDVLNNGAGGVIAPYGSIGGITVEFGAGDDAFNNAGTLIVGSGGDGDLNLANLESFTNSGLIVMGAVFYAATDPFPPPTTGTTGDRLSAPGTDFVASGNSRVVLDARLGLATQATCSAAVTAADCLNFAGGSTEGVTRLLINGVATPDALEMNLTGLALVDVSGGTSHVGDFVIDPASAGYSAEGLFGGGIRRGDYTFTLLYDEGAQIHRLVTLPDPDFAALSAMPGAVGDLWRTADGASRARQGELRRSRQDAVGGTWAKVSGGTTERDAVGSVALFGLTDEVAFGYQQDDAAVSFGGDIVGGGEDNGYAIGLSFGYAQSSVEFDDMPTQLDVSGFTVGLYASYRAGDLFVDASASGLVGEMEGDVAFVPDPVSSDVTAFGARAEAGWRLGMGEGFSISPLASVVYVTSSLSDFELPGDKVNGIAFDNGKSLRGGLGAEAAYGVELGGANLDLSLAGRAWKEFEGETATSIHGRNGATLPFTDDFSGDFGEVTVTADISSPGGGASGFVSVSGRFGDDYSSASAQLGFRLNW